jgi:hypothetical protein
VTNYLFFLNTVSVASKLGMIQIIYVPNLVCILRIAGFSADVTTDQVLLNMNSVV